MRANLIINPNARRLQRSPALLAALCAAAKGRCRVHLTRDLNELDSLCATLKNDSDLLLLAGGDGTLMSGCSALARHTSGPLPAIAPISVGTVGTVARNWGLHGKPIKLLQRLLNRPRRLCSQPSLRVRVQRQSHGGGPDKPTEMIGFIFGTGLVANFFTLYYARGAPGYSGASKLVARIFAESFIGGPVAKQVLTPLPCQLTVAGKRQHPQAWSLICSSVVANLGLGLRLIHRAGEDPHCPHLVATPMLPHQLGPRAPLVFAGRPLGGAASVDQLTPHFSVVFDGDGPFVLDGELLRAQRIDVSAGPLLSVALPT